MSDAMKPAMVGSEGMRAAFASAAEAAERMAREALVEQMSGSAALRLFAEVLHDLGRVA